MGIVGCLKFCFKATLSCWCVACDSCCAVVSKEPLTNKASLCVFVFFLFVFPGTFLPFFGARVATYRQHSTVNSDEWVRLIPAESGSTCPCRMEPLPPLTFSSQSGTIKQEVIAGNYSNTELYCFPFKKNQRALLSRKQRLPWTLQLSKISWQVALNQMMSAVSISCSVGNHCVALG